MVLRRLNADTKSNRSLLLTFLVILFGLAIFIPIPTNAYQANAPITPERERAAFIYNRLTGQKIPIDSPILVDMETLLREKADMAAARLATEQPAFYSHTVRLLGNRLSNINGNLRAPLSDVVATVIGLTKDDEDFRTLLTSESLYRFVNLNNVRNNVVNDIISSNNHYADVETLLASNPNLDIRPNLSPFRQQIANDNNQAVNHPDPAGILSSRAFLEDCANAGTNRRCYAKVISLLTCHALEEVASSSYPDDRIGRDVSRAPGGDPVSYQTSCKSCHSNMDSQRSAFAFIEFDQNRVKHGQVNGGNLFDNSTRVAVKINRLGDGNFVQGIQITSDEWINYAVAGELASKFGWRDEEGRRLTSPVISRGLRAYGQMISRSEAFSNCMAKTVFENICRRTPTSGEMGALRSIVNQWERADGGNYRMRWLFERVATSPLCLGK